MASVLRVSRIVVSVVIFALITALFVDFGMELPAFAAWLAKVQFLPAAMSFAITTFVVWLIVTLIFGRIYCSSFCPLGFFRIYVRGCRGSDGVNRDGFTIIVLR